MGKMVVSGAESGSGAGSVSGNTFPARPAFGSSGIGVILWANYFKMKVQAASLYKYSLTVARLDNPAAEPQKPAPKAKETDTTKQTDPAVPEAKGQKLAKIIALALDTLKSAGAVASEFKQQVISTQKLDLPADGIVNVVLSDTSRPERWAVNFNIASRGGSKSEATPSGPESIHLDRLMTYLKDMKDPGNEAVFPKFPNEIDALNVVLGHTPRADPGVAVVGSSRFFGVDQARADAQDLQGQLIAIHRGYSQSVRTGTGQLLLNTNVTHGVFRRSGNLGDLLREAGLDAMDTDLDRQARPGYEFSLRSVHKQISLARVKLTIPATGPGKPVTFVYKTIAGFCTTLDGARRGQPLPGQERPQFRYSRFHFGGPNSTKFFLGAPRTQDANDQTPPPPEGLTYGTYVTVEDYYISSKLHTPLTDGHG